MCGDGIPLGLECTMCLMLKEDSVGPPWQDSEADPVLLVNGRCAQAPLGGSRGCGSTRRPCKCSLGAVPLRQH